MGSTGQRNGFFEDIGWCLEAERFPRPRVEPQGNLIEVALRADWYVRPVGEVLA